MAIKNVSIGLSETIILTATAETAFLTIVFCNTGVSSRLVQLYMYPTGGSAGNGSLVLKDIGIPAGDTFVWSGTDKILLDVGGVISAIADSASDVTATVSYKVL